MTKKFKERVCVSIIIIIINDTGPIEGHPLHPFIVSSLGWIWKLLSTTREKERGDEVSGNIECTQSQSVRCCSRDHFIAILQQVS